MLFICASEYQKMTRNKIKNCLITTNNSYNNTNSAKKFNANFVDMKNIKDKNMDNVEQIQYEASNGNDIKPCKKSKSESVVVPSATAKGNVHKRNTANNAAMVKKQQRAADANYTHPWLYTTLKGHTGKVLDIDYSSNGKYLATCSEDRTILLWACKDFAKSKDRQSFRINVEYDHAVKVLFSPDSRALIVYKYMQRCVEVYKVDKSDGWFSKPTKGLTYKSVHEEDIVGFGIACTGRFIMTCSNKTDLVVWDLKGNILEKIDTFLINNLCAKVSSCGRFIAASGFASDVQVWEVKFCKIGEFQCVKKVYTLTGHNSGVYDFAFDQDTSHIATVCKDGTWKIFNTHVEYEKGQDPKCIMTGSYEMSSVPALIALSPMSEVVAITNGRSVALYSALTGNLEGKIEKIFADNITAIMFDQLGKYLMISGDRFVRVFHNIPGYKVTLGLAEQKLKQTKTSAMKDRIEAQIDECNEFLNKYV